MANPLHRDAHSRHPASVPDRSHHFGRPFLSAYQIAIAFDQRSPREAALIAKLVGGSDTGRHDSLAEYFANQLSRRILASTPSGIEGRFLNGQFLKSLEYDNDGETVASSLGGPKVSTESRLRRTEPASAVSAHAGCDRLWTPP